MDFEEITVIVSRDTGFQSVRDYWDKRAEHKRRVLLADCVEDGIANSGENSDRNRKLRQLRENLSIQMLMEGKKKTPKGIYLNCLHFFGKDSGLVIYNRMKACVANNFVACQNENGIS